MALAKKRNSIAVAEIALIVVISMLVATEFIATLFSHSLVLRLSVSHSIILLMTTLVPVLTTMKVFQMCHFLRTVSTVICGIALFGLCIVDSIHALQMLTKRHDVGVHFPEMMVAVATFDLVVKETLLIFTSFFNPGFVTLTGMVPLSQESATLIPSARSFGFYLASGVCLLLISLFRLLLSSEHLVLWLDPSLTILLSALWCFLAYPSVGLNVRNLLLATPAEQNVKLLKDLFAKEFPDYRLHHVHMWHNDDRSVCVTAHVAYQCKHKQETALADPDPACACVEYLTRNVTKLFARQGISHVTIQPELISAETLLDREGLVCQLECPDACKDLRCCQSLSPKVSVVRPPFISELSRDPVSAEPNGVSGVTLKRKNLGAKRNPEVSYESFDSVYFGESQSVSAKA